MTNIAGSNMSDATHATSMSLAATTPGGGFPGYAAGVALAPSGARFVVPDPALIHAATLRYLRDIGRAR
jgi:hypothetical protein